DVQSYDRLLTVNGNSVKAAGLVKMIADNRHLELRFQRPVLKEIKLEKKGKTVGFKVDTSLNTYGLVIEDLTEGAALDLPAGTFKPMDRVIAVDGLMTQLLQMTWRMKPDEIRPRSMLLLLLLLLFHQCPVELPFAWQRSSSKPIVGDDQSQ
ncbi:unnamed protein product, partial [Durusdinium trenchii]